MNERLKELIEDINESANVGESKLTPRNSEILFDWGWTKAVIAPQGIFLNVKNTGWAFYENETEDEVREIALRLDQ
jgi:hypothetical protein